MQLAAFKLFNRSVWQKGEVISINARTVWVRIPEVLSPKGRLLRKSRPIKRHIHKDAVLLGSVTSIPNEPIRNEAGEVIARTYGVNGSLPMIIEQGGASGSIKSE